MVFKHQPMARMITHNHPPFITSLDYVAGQGPALVLVASNDNEEIVHRIASRHNDAGGGDLSLIIITVAKSSSENTPQETPSGLPWPDEPSTLPPPGYQKVTYWAEPAASLTYGEKLITRLCNLINDTSFRLVYAPWPFDPDPKLATLALATREAIRRAQQNCMLVLYRMSESGQADYA